MSTPLDSLQPEFQKIKDHLEKELSSIRTGRAAPSLVEQIPVEAYGATMKLFELASISTADPRSLLIQPWDKGLLKDLERALQGANTGCGVAVDGELIRLTVPTLTQETRQAMMKNVQKEVESAKVHLRNVRENVRGKIQALEKDKEISEDEKFRLLKQLDERIKQYQEELDRLGYNKEKELQF